jgi:hypothetical protein
MRSCRSHRSCYATYALRKISCLQLHFFYWILRPWSHYGWLRSLQRSNCYFDCRRDHSQNQSIEHSHRDWRVRPSISNLHLSPHLHWRWWRNGHKGWTPPFWYGIRPISSHWYLWSWMFDNWRMQRLRRCPKKWFRWKIHAQICSFS